MKPVTKTAMSTAVGLIALSLTACGGSSGGSDAKPARPEQSKAAPSSSVSPSMSPVPQKPVPAVFDNTKGWSVDEHPDGGQLDYPVIAPDSGLVLLRWNSDDATSRIVARDAKSGAVRWSSKPISRPKAGGQLADVRLLVTHKDGKEYAVLARSGTEGGDAVNNGSDVTRLAVYDTSSSGDQVAPLREVTVPGLAFTGYTALRDGGTVLVQFARSAAIVDVTTGQSTTYDAQNPALQPPKACPQLIGDCSTNARIVGQTPAGPLVLGFRAFWSNGWICDYFVPAGAKPAVSSQNVTVYSSPGGQVVAAWPKDGGVEAVWAVHDGRTGQVIASVECTQSQNTGLQPSLSEDGRYLIANLAVFDLQAKQGHCLEATSARKGIAVTVVDKDGTAYGAAGNGGQGTVPTSVALTSDQASPLPEGTFVPDLIGAGVGVFGTSTAGGERIFVYPHR